MMMYNKLSILIYNLSLLIFDSSLGTYNLANNNLMNIKYTFHHQFPPRTSYAFLWASTSSPILDDNCRCGDGTDCFL